MNYSLLHIELHIDDHWIEQAEILLEKKAVENLLKVDKNLWIANVLDRKTYEVEIQLAANRVKEMSCECDQFVTNQLCKHTVATLLAVREQKKKEKEASTEKRKRRTNYSNKKLTLNAILDAVSHEDLIAFTRAYARSNRNFGLALKANFAGSVDIIDAKQKYLQVLDAAISIHKSAKGNFTQRSIKHILKIVHQLKGQTDDAIALKNYAEAKAIIDAILEKISPIIRFGERMEEEIKKIVLEQLELLQEILEEPIAPVLQEAIWENLFIESFKSFYFNANLENHFFTLLLEQTDEEEKFTRLHEVCNQQMTRRDIHQSAIVNIIAFKYSLFEKEGNYKAAQQLIEDNLSNPAILILAIENALAKEDLSQAKKLAHTGKENNDIKKVNIQLDQYLLQIADLEQDEQAIFEYAKACFLSTYDMMYYRRLLDSPLSTPELSNTLIQTIERHPYSLQKRDTIAAIYDKEEKYEALLKYIQRIQSLDLLVRYDKDLMTFDKKQVYHLYESILRQYLKNHLGRVPAQKVGKIIQHIRSIAAHDLADRLVDLLRADFAERHSLMEEIAFF